MTTQTTREWTPIFLEGSDDLTSILMEMKEKLEPLGVNLEYWEEEDEDTVYYRLMKAE